jgi:hypothetical protein
MNDLLYFEGNVWIKSTTLTEGPGTTYVCGNQKGGAGEKLSRLDIG